MYSHSKVPLSKMFSMILYAKEMVLFYCSVRRESLKEDVRLCTTLTSSFSRFSVFTSVVGCGLNTLLTYLVTTQKGSMSLPSFLLPPCTFSPVYPGFLPPISINPYINNRDPVNHPRPIVLSSVLGSDQEF